MARLAWFSPMPPVRTGRRQQTAPPWSRNCAPSTTSTSSSMSRSHALPADTRSAHDFVWRHQQQPYDLTIYQLGNSSHHDYLWPYLFRFPGLTVLHDVHLHHARAASLLGSRRADEYRAEFAWNHPDADRDLAELAVAGFDNHLYYCLADDPARDSRVADGCRPQRSRWPHRCAPRCPRPPSRPFDWDTDCALPPDQEENARAALRAAVCDRPRTRSCSDASAA